MPTTVLGTPLAERYDLVLAREHLLHEHLLINIRCWLDGGDPGIRDARVGEDTVARAAGRTSTCRGRGTSAGSSCATWTSP